jgi:aspartate oxidase
MMNLFLYKYFSYLVFGESTQCEGNDEEELGGDGEDAGDEEESCHECMVKEMEIEELKKRNAKQQEKACEWYENEAEKQKQTFLKKLRDQEEEIESLKKENKLLKERNHELAGVKDTNRDEMRFQPTTSSSIVAQAMTSIVCECL